MSEIFNYLKRTEFEKREIGGGIPMPSSETVFEPDSNGNDPVLDLKSTDPEISHPPATAPENDGFSMNTELRSAESLNLDLADYRVKSVWDPETLVGEQFRLLRAKLVMMQKQRRIKTLLVTSAAPSEGKTFVACSLAGVLSQQPGSRVLLVDSDLRKPKAAQNLGFSNYSDVQGFADVLKGKIEVMDALTSSKNSGLFFLPAGQRPENPAELLSSALLARSLNLLSGHFNWIVIDSPPAVALADTSVLASVCDAVLLVVHSCRTPAKMIRDSIESLGGEKICGVILNRTKRAESSRYYYSYYRESSRQKNKK
jgi:protein-tyrosine kinase